MNAIPNTLSAAYGEIQNNMTNSNSSIVRTITHLEGWQ